MSHLARSPRLYLGGLLCLMTAMGGTARADRTLLAPDAEPLRADGIKMETFYSPYRANENLSFLQYASPASIELEYIRYDLRDDFKLRQSFNIQYPVLTTFGDAPALSVGVRDLFGTGLERQSLYFAAGKTIPLSDSQARLWRELRWNVGYGTGYMSGPFVSFQARLRSGLGVSAEYFRRRPNVGVSLPLLRNLQAKAMSLDGNVFYGLTYILAR